MINYLITKEHTKLLKEVSELIVEKKLLLKNLPIDFKEAIHKYIKISSIGATSRIENAILTDIQIDWLNETLTISGKPTAYREKKSYIHNKLSKENERSIEEIAGCRNMLTIIYNQGKEFFPLTESLIRNLHSELLQFFPKASHHLGQYKNITNSVVEKDYQGKICNTVLKTAESGPITQAAMGDLVKWYNETIVDHPWTIAVAAEFVFRFLAIHPFLDGNGRVGRALFIIALLQSPDKNLSNIVPYLAIDRHMEKNKQEYYLVLRKCSDGIYSDNPAQYKIDYFLKFLIKITKEALSEDIDYCIRRHEAFITLNGTAKNILKCFKEYPEMKLGTKNLLDELNIPRRTIIHSLNILVKLQFLHRYGKGAGTRYQLTF